MRGRFDSRLECYIGGGFWQQVLEPHGEIWPARYAEFRALTGSRRIATRRRPRIVSPANPPAMPLFGSEDIRRHVQTSLAIVAFWTHCPDKVVWERSMSGRTPLRMVGDRFHAEQVVNAESFPNYRAHPIGQRGMSRVCGVFRHLRVRAERGRCCRGSWHGGRATLRTRRYRSLCRRNIAASRAGQLSCPLW